MQSRLLQPGLRGARHGHAGVCADGLRAQSGGGPPGGDGCGAAGRLGSGGAEERRATEGRDSVGSARQQGTRRGGELRSADTRVRARGAGSCPGPRGGAGSPPTEEPRLGNAGCPAVQEFAERRRSRRGSTEGTSSRRLCIQCCVMRQRRVRGTRPGRAEVRSTSRVAGGPGTASLRGRGRGRGGRDLGGRGPAALAAHWSPAAAVRGGRRRWKLIGLSGKGGKRAGAESALRPAVPVPAVSRPAAG